MKLLIVLAVVSVILFIKYITNKDDKFGKNGILLIVIAVVIFIVAEVVFKMEIIKWLLK